MRQGNKLKKKDASFSDFRQANYESLQEDYAQFFNFFYQNNDIFKMMDVEDEQILDAQKIRFINTTMKWTIGSFLGVLFTDQVIFRYAFPKFRINQFRGLLFLGKYIAIPLLSFEFAAVFLLDDVDESYRTMAEKYGFNYSDYNRAMDILERAQRVGRLEELLANRSNFDWTGIPEFKSSISKKFD